MRTASSRLRGAINNSMGGLVEVTDCTATGGLYGLSLMTSQGIVRNCNFKGNLIDFHGGIAVAAKNGSTLEIYDSVISGDYTSVLIGDILSSPATQRPTRRLGLRPEPYAL